MDKAIKNIRVCVINISDIPDEVIISSLSESEWIEITKKYGNLYSLEEFENVFNDTGTWIISPDTQYIKFI